MKMNKTPERTYNPVHTYVKGKYFKNIFGGVSESQYGSIVHMTYLSPEMEYRCPWLKNKWVLSNGTGNVGNYKTLKEAKAEALRLWPDCWFMTPAQSRKRSIVKDLKNNNGY